MDRFCILMPGTPVAPQQKLFGELFRNRFGCVVVPPKGRVIARAQDIVQFQKFDNLIPVTLNFRL